MAPEEVQKRTGHGGEVVIFDHELERVGHEYIKSVTACSGTLGMLTTTSGSLEVGLFQVGPFLNIF